MKKPKPAHPQPSSEPPPSPRGVRCRDGTYSPCPERKRGVCSHHGGVMPPQTLLRLPRA